MTYFVYMMASKKDGVIYTGVTSNLVARNYEHKQSIKADFTNKYFVKRLVYFEAHQDIREAIKKEKQLKRWRRAWKVELIEKDNPDWKDLTDAL